ncbi:branched-chain amino acid ABC transporter permease [Desulfosoma caldarium]|uniref:Branched-chain amino acid transport system permease protein n=1 Tax=Desulfosoma caldarium TaxID=610254 RepID=A0A3N1UV50_9BACT|nr:branched-chain amino acid ABC transporter permease [Desulfosoma caldarium]ROQ91006.1 branched-chain amino acid transport system permease protein [Desulfosoma caldarium]
MWAQFLIGVLSLGFFYTLTALGFSLIFGVTHAFNLAHGELIVLSGYLAYALMKGCGWAFWMTLPVCMLGLSLLLVGIHQLLNRVGEPFELNSLVMTFGLALIAQNLMLFLFGADYRLIPSFDEPVWIAFQGAQVSSTHLWSFLLSCTATAAVFLMLHRTFLGKALRATIQEREAARLAGIHVHRMRKVAFAIGGLLIGLAGPLFGRLAYLHPAGGTEATLVAIVITIFAGVGHVRSLWVGACALAALESGAALVLGTSWRELVSALILIVLLLWKPHGLLVGKRSAPEL